MRWGRRDAKSVRSEKEQRKLGDPILLTSYFLLLTLLNYGVQSVVVHVKVSAPTSNVPVAVLGEPAVMVPVPVVAPARVIAVPPATVPSTATGVVEPLEAVSSKVLQVVHRLWPITQMLVQAEGALVGGEDIQSNSTVALFAGPVLRRLH